MEAPELADQKRRAFLTLTRFNWVGIVLCVPLSMLVAAIFSREDGASAGGIAFGILAFAAAVAWAILLYRRIAAPDLGFDERAKRLGHAAMTAAYPAYLGIGVTIVTGAAIATLPFIGVASFNVAALRRLGDTVLPPSEAPEQP